tara:strand:- start:417 stop:590 length:174 start_codon:yes stop_codon:yes gene_type:complete
MQAIAEKDEEGDRVVLTLQEEVKNMTEKEYQKWLQRYERNMCPADLYDGQEDLVAPI